MKNKGFSFIEIMITVLIIGIIGSIAHVSYKDNLLKAEAVTGLALLSNIRIKLEQHFQDNRTYNGGCTIIEAIPNDRYTIECETDPTSPINNESIQKYFIRITSDNFTYTLDQSNAKNTEKVPSDWIGVDSSCLVVSKNGACN